jgi:hypothetical protein
MSPLAAIASESDAPVSSSRLAAGPGTTSTTYLATYLATASTTGPWRARTRCLARPATAWRPQPPTYVAPSLLFGSHTVESAVQLSGSRPSSQILEPDEIKARFLTEEDDLIRARDIPERHQLLNSTLSANPTYIPEPFPVFPPVETASLWIAPRISARTKAFLSPKLESCAGAGLGAAEGDVHRHFIEAVQRVLGYLFVEHLEVPFIWEHRRDYIVHYRKNEQGNAPSATDSGSGRVCLLERNELWKVYELGTKYRSLMRRKDALDTIWNRLRERKKEAWRAELDVIVDENGAEISPTQDGPAPDVLERYYTDKIDGSGGLAEEGIEGVMDAMEWVGLRWARELREMREEEDEAMKARGERRQKRPNEGAIKRAAELREGRAGSALRVRPLPRLGSTRATRS